MNARFLIFEVRGWICESLGVWDPIRRADVFAVPSRGGAEGAAAELAAAAPSRRETRQLSAGEAERLSAAEGAVRGSTDEEGRFESQAGGAHDAAWDVYVNIRAVPTPGAREPFAELREPVLLFVGTFRPRQGIVPVYVPAKLYCLLKRRADWWTIAGRLTVCGGDEPITGAVVTALDVDLVQHDVLGSGTTDANGVFRIDYPGSAFRQGTWIDVELFGGPDVYFRVEDTGGTLLFEEPRTRGRAKDRKDRGPCFCVELCHGLGGGGTPGTGGPNAWTKVGTAFTIPDSTSLNSFDAAGYAGAAKFAIGGAPVLKGSIDRFVGGSPVEYRFLVSSTTTPNAVGGPSPAAGFTPVEGSRFAEGVEIGQMVRASPLKIVSITPTAADLDGDGWLNVERVIQRVFTEPAQAGLNVVDFQWGHLGALMGLNTGALTTQDKRPPIVVAAGVSVPAGDKRAIETFSIRFESRRVDATTGVSLGSLPSSGTTLNSVILSNDVAFARVELPAHGGEHGCDPVSGVVDIAYTAYHPHLQDVSLLVESNAGGYLHTPTFVAGNTNPAVVEAFDPAHTLPGTLHRCTYFVKLSATRRVHDGQQQLHHSESILTFFFEP